jgi:hypothetical protein
VAVTYGYGDHDVLAAACPDGLLGDLTKITSIRLRPRPDVPASRVVS